MVKLPSRFGIPAYVFLLIHVVWLPIFLFVPSCVAETVPTQCVSTSLQPSKLVEDKGRLRGIRSNYPTDFVLGVLLPVHNSAANSSGGRCGDALTDQGVQRVEEILYTIDCINSNPDLLPNVTLGYDIRDTCYSQNIALDESLDILVAESVVHLESCSTTNLNNLTDDSYLIGVIGATASGVTVPVASLLRLFSVTQVSYLSTSPLLSNRDRYEYFLRTVPPDNLQAAAMFKLAVHFDWTLVSIVHSNDAYGSLGAHEFRQIAQENDDHVCIDLDISIDLSFTDEEHRAVALRLVNESKANVVILFSAVSVAKNFFTAMNSTPGSQRFVWIGSDGVVSSDTIQKSFSHLLQGMFGFYPDANSYAGFESYYSTLTLRKNERNKVWYKELCDSFSQSCNDNLPVASDPRYKEDSSGTLVVDAIYTFANALNQILKDNCAQPVVWNRTSQSCIGQKRNISRSLILEYAKRSDFVSPTGFRVAFNQDGNRVGSYSVLNFQTKPDGYELVRIGTYNPVNDTIELNPSVEPGINQTYIESQCKKCKPGFVVNPIPGSCCGTCLACLGNTIANLTIEGTTFPTECTQCGQYMWGNNPLNGSTACTRLSDSYLKVSDIWGAIIVTISIIGLILVLIVSIILGIFWNKPVFKSSAREQMVLLLVGLTLCFTLPLFYIIQPSLGICLIQRAGIWCCFSLMFGALLVKSIRIARIFHLKTATRPRFIEWYYQIIFTFVIVAGQMVLVVISLVVVHPTIFYELRSNPDDSNDFPTLLLTCRSPNLVIVILLILYDTIIIVINNVLALFTIRYPENFNEARHVSLSTFSVAAVWIVFIPSYFATQIEYKPGIVGLAILLSGYAVLLCLFGPRVYIAFTKAKAKEQPKVGITINTTSTCTFGTSCAEDSSAKYDDVQLKSIETTKS